MIQIANEAGIVRVKLPKRFDIEEVSRCRNEVYKLLDEHISKMVFDCAECDFIDSTGLGLLVSAFKRCAEHKVGFALCSLRENVTGVIKLTRLDQVFTIHNSYSDAVRG